MDAIALNNNGRPNATRARGHPQLSISLSPDFFIGSTTTKVDLVDKVSPITSRFECSLKNLSVLLPPTKTTTPFLSTEPSCYR
jgi:hypothetical protein